ncbi:MAG: hypothetical protein IJB81_09160 [Clostridia bacterium]|nr:hypothetical protein [Clostridia bacterium]
MSDTTTRCTFTRDSLTIDGITRPAEYSVTPAGTVFVFVAVDVDGQERKVRIKIPADDPRYAAALAAAQEPQPEPEQPAQEQPADVEPEQPAQEQPADVEPEQAQEEQPQEEQPQEEQPARDPKQARGPVPDKAFVGLEIKGKGWKIVFDGSYDRTRVIFKRKPSNAAREALDKHGFFWSPAMQSWNKKLTHKAFRAAQALALELRTICG